MSSENHISTPTDWRAASRATREARAEPLRLPSGTTILAVKPEPLEWIMSGRIPQRLLAAALRGNGSAALGTEAEISREEILDLARFAAQLVKASVVKPAIGDGPDEMSMDDIPIEDRAFIFQWACRTLSQSPSTAGLGSAGAGPAAAPSPDQEGLSSEKLERFCAK